MSSGMSERASINKQVRSACIRSAGRANKQVHNACIKLLHTKFVLCIQSNGIAGFLELYRESFKSFHMQVVVSCYVGETNRHFATRIREHLSSDKNSHIFKHLRGSENCRSLCSEDCFQILDSASTSFQLKIKEAMHILWEQPSLNSQVKHLNLSLSY